MSEQHRRSQSAREQSMSVSPKTRLPSQPLLRTELTPQSESTHSSSSKQMMEEDQEMEIEQGSFAAQNNAKQESTGNPVNRVPSQHPQAPAQQPAPRKRIRYTEPPIWAQSVKVKGLSSLRGPVKINGKQLAEVTHTAATSSPPAKQNGIHQASHADNAELSDAVRVSRVLGPWEESITNTKPSEQMTKLVADFLFLNVVSRDDFGELSSRGIEVEIEAKLGQLIDKDTNDRLRLPIMTECILQDTSRISFRSSMTEVSGPPIHL